MNIKTRLSVQFTLLVTVILIFFSGLVYYFSFTGQRAKFTDNLMNRAKNTAILLIKVEEVDSTLLNKIHQSTISWEDEEIVLTDSSMVVLYNYNAGLLTDNVLVQYMSDSETETFSLKNKDCVRYRYKIGNSVFYVFVAAVDTDRPEYLASLRKILLWSILFSSWLSVLISYIFSRRAIRPISDMISRIKKITAEKLGERLDEGRRKDEIEQLSITFNEMLTNIESAFRSQEEFVTNASHELRTPLAVMISETDYIINREAGKEALLRYSSKMLDDLKNLNLKTNSLLELAHINRINAINLIPVRVDEVIYSSVREVRNRYPDRKILSRTEYSEDETDFLIYGNSGLLEIAFRNILDNACKFSSHDIGVELLKRGELVCIIITDKGIGIPNDEIDAIYLPFTRASNAKYVSGFGIGLALVSRIVKLHNAGIKISSNQNSGTTVEIIFRRKAD